MKIGVLFVCLGNICRSPLAEAVFRDQADRAGLADRFEVDSAGTSDYHIGEAPDERTIRTAAARGLHVDHSSRQVDGADFERFDYILAMDTNNLRRIERLAGSTQGKAQVALLREFDAAGNGGAEVPDPYFGGERGFDDVHDLVERACRGLLAHIIAEHHLT